MSETLIGVALVTLVGVGHGFLIGEAKGWLNDILRRYAKKASVKIPGDHATDTSDEWDAELASLVDRPIRALLFAGGLRRASRTITSYLEITDPGSMGVDIGELIHGKTGIAADVKPAKWGLTPITQDALMWEALADECITLGVTEDELVSFAVLYYLADRDSGRVARGLPPSS